MISHEIADIAQIVFRVEEMRKNEESEKFNDETNVFNANTINIRHDIWLFHESIDMIQFTWLKTNVTLLETDEEIVEIEKKWWASQSLILILYKSERDS